ncbi:uncharacterized protein JCM6883_000314 [Sporobolomyces salmoneus]|uniref:uncharacterized protein n=1 Tax=Sporobolomyces salmoneus TaxID=183962 RepID=UPI00317357B0
MPNPIINTSMRENYNSFGVSNYYNLVQESYRNPHYPGLKKCLAQLMDTYLEKEKPTTIKVLDLAAGSGEATEALLAWRSSRWPSSTPSNSSTTSPIPPSETFSSSARPRAVVRPQRPVTTPSIPEPTLSIVATDPFTSPAYRQRTGLDCLELSFNQVAAGELPSPSSSSSSSRIQRTEDPSSELTEEKEPEEEGETEEEELYDLVIVSFALHLVETPSELWALLTELAKRARWLCVIAPHKKPDIKSTWGWRRWDPSKTKWGPAEGRGNVGGQEGDGFEIVLDRVRLRLWRSEENWEET